jgi:hypothetical protein
MTQQEVLLMDDTTQVTGRLIQTLGECDADVGTILEAARDMVACIIIADDLEPEVFTESLLRRVAEIRGIVWEKSSATVATAIASRIDES